MGDLDAETGEAPGKGLHMLASQHGGGRHHGHLTAGEDRGGGGTQGHLGLAEADIAADEPIHRPPRGEIAHHPVHGARLICGEVESETGGEALHLPDRGGQDRRLDLPARLGIGEHHAGRLGHAGLGFKTPTPPGPAFEFVEGHRLGLRAVAPDPVGLGDGDHQDRVSGKTQTQGVLAAFRSGLDMLQSLEDAQTVVAIDRHIADAQLDLADGKARRRLALSRSGGAAPEQVGGCNDTDTLSRHPEPRLDGSGQRQDRTGPGTGNLRPVRHLSCLTTQHTLGDADQATERLLRSRQQDAFAAFEMLAQGLGEGRIRTGFPHEGRNGEILGFVRRRGGDTSLLLKGSPTPGVEIEVPEVTVPVAGIAPFGDLFEEGGGTLFGTGLDHEAGIRNVVEHRRERRVEAGKLVLLTGEGPQLVLRSLRQKDLRGRVDDQSLGLRQGALGDRIVGPDRDDAAVLVLDPAGARRSGGEHVHRPSPHRHLAWLVDPVVQDVAESLQRRGDRRRVEIIANADLEMGVRPCLGRWNPLDQCGGGRQDDVGQGGGVREPAQHARALPHDAARRRGPVEGQAIPFRVDRNAAIGCQRPQDRRDGLLPVRFAHHVDQGLVQGHEVEERHGQGADGNEGSDDLFGGVVGRRPSPAFCHRGVRCPSLMSGVGKRGPTRLGSRDSRSVPSLSQTVPSAG